MEGFLICDAPPMKRYKGVTIGKLINNFVLLRVAYMFKSSSVWTLRFSFTIVILMYVIDEIGC